MKEKAIDRKVNREGILLRKKELLLGGILLVGTFLMPLLFNVDSMGIMEALLDAARYRRDSAILLAALQLVALNSIRAVPHYLGTFFFSESIELSKAKRYRIAVHVILSLVILRMVYQGIEVLYHIRYDFGVPAILVFSFVVLFRRMNYRFVSLWKKGMLISLVLTAMQFLDIMPMMDPFHVGRGETSLDIKLMASLMGEETMLNALGIGGITLFLTFALVILLQLRDENRLYELSELREQNREIHVQARLAETQARNIRETQYLVHDLKSPLTAIQAIVGVIKMEHEMESREQDMEYLNHIEGAVEQMSIMISELLYADRRNPVTTEKIISIVLSQISPMHFSTSVHARNEIPEARILVNKIQFARALVNLIQNAARAIPEDRTPEISLHVKYIWNEAGEKKILFQIEDNGVGISQERLKNIWESGHSGWNSSGLGLSFVKNIVENSDGSIRIRSVQGKGTVFSILLGEEGAENEG